ncbi:unnamed protein product, partial [Prorocentrum cordatum]
CGCCACTARAILAPPLLSAWRPWAGQRTSCASTPRTHWATASLGGCCPMVSAPLPRRASSAGKRLPSTWRAPGGTAGRSTGSSASPRAPSSSRCVISDPRTTTLGRFLRSPRRPRGPHIGARYYPFAKT